MRFVVQRSGSLELLATESTALSVCPVLFVIALAGADAVLVVIREVLAELAHEALLKAGACVGAFTVNGDNAL